MRVAFLLLAVNRLKAGVLYFCVTKRILSVALKGDRVLFGLALKAMMMSDDFFKLKYLISHFVNKISKNCNNYLAVSKFGIFLEPR